MKDGEIEKAETHQVASCVMNLVTGGRLGIFITRCFKSEYIMNVQLTKGYNIDTTNVEVVTVDVRCLRVRHLYSKYLLGLLLYPSILILGGDQAHTKGLNQADPEKTDYGELWG